MAQIILWSLAFVFSFQVSAITPTHIQDLLKQMRENHLTLSSLKQDPAYLGNYCGLLKKDLLKEQIKSELKEAYEIAFKLTFNHRLLPDAFYQGYQKTSAAFLVASHFSQCALALRGKGDGRWNIDSASFTN